MNARVARQLVALGASGALLLAACRVSSTAHHPTPPAHLDHVEGEEVARITLTERAIQRIDLRTDTVEQKMGGETTQGGSSPQYPVNVEGTADSAGEVPQNNGPPADTGQPEQSKEVRTVPYAALIYDAHGDTWVYEALSERTFRRQPIHVDRIEDDKVQFTEGPPVGTKIVTQAVAELYGTEFEVGH